MMTINVISSRFPVSLSGTVTNPISPLALKGFAVSHTAIVPKNPLHVISARTPFFLDLYNDGTEKLVAFLDTLDCGHQVVVYPFDPGTGQKRHRCADCAVQAKASSPKKPVGSVSPSPLKKRTA